MGNVVDPQLPHPEALELPLPWGPVARGFRWPGQYGTAVLLHEPGSDVDAWDPLPGHIARQLEIETFALDLPGHGLADDPWEPARLPDLLRGLREIVPGANRRFIIAAGLSATTALALAADLGLSGLVSLSAEAPSAGSNPVRSPGVPKLFFAGSLAGDDLDTARRLASVCGGWSTVTTLPLAACGTALLASTWRGRLTEAIVAFLRDCQQPRRNSRLTRTQVVDALSGADRG